MIRIWSQLKVGPTVQWRLWSCEGPRLDLKYWRTFLPRKEKHQQLRCFPLNTKLSNIVWNVWRVRSVVCVSARVFLVFRAASSGWKWVYICPHKSVCLVEEVIDQIRRPVLGSLPWPVSSKGLAGSGTWVIFTWPDHQTPNTKDTTISFLVSNTPDLLLAYSCHSRVSHSGPRLHKRLGSRAGRAGRGKITDDNDQCPVCLSSASLTCHNHFNN